MALKDTTTNNYYRIISVDPYSRLITIEKWKDYDHRQSGGDEFSRPVLYTELIADDILAITCENGLTLEAQLKKIGYNELKKMTKYEGYEDC
ncbi:hypothetical protein [Tenuifilum osseticum]|jgi:hypothetical protein|uniref:hypothetical protein n=1 Tax=Tenuifilum osseticum TaxID=3374723 RepID=UPI0034E5C160